MNLKSRIEREEETLISMIDMYCKKNHKTKVMCLECNDLSGYAVERLHKCIKGKSKPICGKCEIHCYKPEMREKIKKVMRDSGPRMIFYHPLLAIMHLFDTMMY
ncbi:nitrous oxide-stimulated promoter family protein [Alkalibacter mobilis]|uniref:nitrous oxide-stimulated promoter family protein n=1 Tax=Alkalibacter mobilis TaxID=2787712 RepID=UPI00189C6E51|nr:nitrous oxide-stimulated promoter family protein [Alkalibacter mobilis]MBF7097364.1 nitrous oxide-stimulated promoter family protein [Alkalibacter mobilis]